MERWRWVPRDLGKTYVMVNIPDYTLRVVRDEKLVWKTKVVVGKPNLPTPLLSAEMKFITVNPTWNVPPSIIQNEYLPALQQDPQAMERIGLKVEQNRDGTVRIWQPPGDRNALGRIRFNFPNKFLVYQHDTPDKHLFAHDKRAYSHGCMRVQDPLKYGEVLLSLALPNENYTAERLQKMFGGSEININFPQNIPVHLTYQTAFVDDDGKLQIRDDVYGRDQRLLAILKGSDRKMADIAIDRPKGSSSAPVQDAARHLRRRWRRWSGSSFFERLFGGAPEPAPQAARPRRRQRPARHAALTPALGHSGLGRSLTLRPNSFWGTATKLTGGIPHGYRSAGRGGRGHSRLQPLRKGTGDQRRRRAGRDIPRRPAHHPLRRDRNPLWP